MSQDAPERSGRGWDGVELGWEERTGRKAVREDSKAAIVSRRGLKETGFSLCRGTCKGGEPICGVLLLPVGCFPPAHEVRRGTRQGVCLNGW